MRPLVSVIVPVYNAEARVEKCVKSILSQTYSNLEIICIDDGSRDNSPLILDELAKEDTRIKVIHNENQGVSATRNCGIDNATGEYIQFVDSDDEIYNNMIECLVETILKDGSDLVFCGYHRSDGIDVHVPMNGIYTIEDVIKDFCVIYKGGVFNQPWNKLYKKELMTCRFNNWMSIAEDAVLNVQYLRNTKKISFIDELAYYYVVDSPNSLSVRYNERALESEKTKIIEINSLLKDFGFLENVLKLNPDYEQDFKRCVYQMVYASGKSMRILKNEIETWVYDDTWQEVLIKNRNIKKIHKYKTRLMINCYVYMIRIVKKIRSVIK